MAKQSQVKSKRKLLNPLFHFQTKKEDDSQLTKGMIKVARKSGQLNLSGRSLATVPTKMFTMYELDEEETVVNYDLSKCEDEPWWTYRPLTYLDLSSNVIQTIPPEIKMFGELIVLNLQDNCLTVIPPEIGSLIKLTKLNLSRNKIKALPKEFYKLVELKQLSLAYNCLDKLTDDIGDLIMLNQLDLSHNNLTVLPAGVGFVARLTEINLSHNQLTELPPDIISLRALVKLDITHNNLKGLPKIHFLRKLQFLYAQHNDIEDLPDFEGCESIQQLYFGNNFIKEITAEFCDALINLKVLDLRDNKIEIIPDDIAKFQNLIRLDLTNNEIRVLPNTLCYLAHLQNLQIEGNKLKQIRSDIMKGGTVRILSYLREKLTPEASSEHFASNDETQSPTSPRFPDIYAMKHTRSITLGMRDLSTVPDNVFQDAEKALVTAVDLCKNKFTTVPGGLKFIASNLTELNLSTNRIRHIPDFLQECRQLHYLDISKNMLEDLPYGMENLREMRELVLANNRFLKIPTCVYGMRGLEILQVSENQISEINVEGLMQLRRLATLDLANNNISYVPPQLGNITQLRSLELRGNNFRQPRYAILEQGTDTILSYLRDKIPRYDNEYGCY